MKRKTLIEKQKEDSNNFLLKETKECDYFFRKNKILSLYNYNKYLYEKIETNEIDINTFHKMQLCISEGGKFEEKVLCGLYKINNSNTKLGEDGKKIKKNIKYLFEIKTERFSSYHPLRGEITWDLLMIENVIKKFNKDNWYFIYGGYTKDRKLICSYYCEITKKFINGLKQARNKYKNKTACKIPFKYFINCDIFLKYKSDDYYNYCTKPFAEFLENLEYRPVIIK